MDKTVYHGKGGFRGAGYLLLVFLFLLLIQGCRTNRSEVRVLFTGDILLSRNVNKEILTRNTSPWEKLKPLLHSADLVIGNLEGAVGKSNDTVQTYSGSPLFIIDHSNIPLLSDAGFNIITLENNHIGDGGENGKENTIEALQNSNIKPLFFENSPQFFPVKNIVIALITFNMVPGRDSSIMNIPSVGLQQKLRMARSLAKIVIVSIHWGSELLDWPTIKQRETAKWLIDNGADIIIGSHPHVVQNPEIIEGKPVFFSLGNHLFDQKYPKTKEGLIVDIRIRRKRFDCSGIITHTEPGSFYPVITGKKDYHFGPLQLKSKDLQINGFTIKPLSVNDGHQYKTILEAFQKRKKVWRTYPMSIVTVSPSRFDGKKEYLLMLEKHFSNLDGEISLRPYVYQVDITGLIPRWRGSALAWPLLDALVLPGDGTILCALHRGDSFINPDKNATYRRIAAYHWNGFGFTGVNDSTICESCNKLFGK